MKKSVNNVLEESGPAKILDEKIHTITIVAIENKQLKLRKEIENKDEKFFDHREWQT